MISLIFSFYLLFSEFAFSFFTCGETLFALQTLSKKEKIMVGKYKVVTFCGSTRSEIEYATAAGKAVRYLEEVCQEAKHDE